MSSLRGKNAAVYARFSSENQRDASIEDQVRVCRQYIERHGGSLSPHLIFHDAAKSGASLARDGFKQLMVLVEQRQVDAIVVEDTSRLSRDLADSASVLRQLEYLGVALISVGDGLDTRRESAEVAFGFKSVMDHVARREIGRRTLRGLRGRALHKQATGGLAFGFRSRPVEGSSGKIVGHEIEVDGEKAAIVRRIFHESLEGKSYKQIAQGLTEDGIATPRDRRTGRRGWVASTIRSMLKNDAYIGRFRYGRRKWLKEPGTGKRRYRDGDPDEMIEFELPDCRIIDQAVWDQVHQRLEAVRAKSTGKRGRGTAPCHRTERALSGLLVCGVCGANMTISGGSSATYYKCVDYKKRGTCKNGMSVREDLVKARIIEALRHTIFTPEAVDELRRNIAHHLAEASREANRRLDELQARLARTRGRIDRLIHLLADGVDSDAVRKSLADFEAQARTDEREIARMLKAASSPIHLPSPAEVLQRAMVLERVLDGNPLAAREHLRRLFVDGRIVLEPQPEGYYVARAGLFPLLALQTTNPPAGAEGSSRGTPVGCAGRI